MMLSTVPNVSTAVVVHILEPAARSLALGCVAGFALAISRAKNISLRLGVWKSVLCIALAMPLLSLLLPTWSFHVPVAQMDRLNNVISQWKVASAVLNQPENTKVAAINVVAGHPNDSGTFEAVVPHDRSKTRSAALNMRSAPHARFGIAPSSSATSEKDSHFPARLRIANLTKFHFSHVSWMAVTGATYLVVVAIFLMRFVLGLFLGRRLDRAAHPINDSRALAMLSSHARAAGLQAPPRLAESELLTVPLTFGVLRPSILLPTAWRDWSDTELDAVISHEISHVARRDALTERLSLLHRALFWFSPLGWWLHRCLAELAEEASDEAVLAAGTDRTRYAETLLGFFADVEAAPGRAWWQGVAMATAGQAEKRLDRILGWKGSVAMQLKKSVVAVLVLCAVPVVYVAAALRPGSYNSHSAQYGSVQEQSPTPPLPAPSPTVTPIVAPVAPVVSVSAIAKVMPDVSVMALNPIEISIPAPLPRLPQSSRSNFTVVRSGGNDGQQFVISSGNTYVSVSGDNESYGTDHPSEFVELLQEKISGDFIWFRRDGKSYVIHDPTTIKRAKDFFTSVQALDQKQEELGKQQEALGQKQEVLGKQQEAIRVQVPDMSEDFHKLEVELKALGANASEDDLGRIQSEIGELQGKLGELQSKAGEEQGKLGEKQGALGEAQGKLGEEQGELGRQEEKIFKDASRQMKTLIDDAITKNLAKPE